MAAPNLTITYTRDKISANPGYDSVTVTFYSDIEYQAAECRVTKEDEEHGVGKGVLVGSFPYTPANRARTLSFSLPATIVKASDRSRDYQFDVYHNHLIRGDGKYFVWLYAQGKDGTWNDS